jgi:hypothetical protein
MVQRWEYLLVSVGREWADSRGRKGKLDPAGNKNVPTTAPTRRRGYPSSTRARPTAPAGSNNGHCGVGSRSGSGACAAARNGHRKLPPECSHGA